MDSQGISRSPISTRGVERLNALVRKCTRDESGTTSVEYALIAGTLTVALAAILTGIKDELNSPFNVIEEVIADANAG